MAKPVKQIQEEINEKHGKDAVKTGDQVKSPQKPKTEEKQVPAPKDGEYDNVADLLWFIQQNLKAPKGQRNTHGNYNYRSAEDILEAVKKLLPRNARIKTGDEVVMIGDRYYVKATVKLIYKGETESETAFARETLDRKGMDASQITGATSSYARKYAMNGLFAIDDTKDADTDESHNQSNSRPNTRTQKSYNKPTPKQEPEKKEMVTSPQAKRISQLITDLGLDIDDMKAHVKKVYKRDSVQFMTKKQASHFIVWLKQQEPAMPEYGESDIDLDEVDRGIEEMNARENQ